LGPNGAGKSSTIRMIACTSEVSGGELFVLGEAAHPENRRLKARLGVVAQEDYLDPTLTVRENLLVQAAYYGLPRRIAAERADELLAFMQLTAKRDEEVESLSGGMRRRLVIARALMNRPDLLILDEPTTGLDPQARLLVWQKLLALRGEGIAILLTTHYMDEAERLCERVMVMDQGRILAEGPPQELIRREVGQWVVETIAPEEVPSVDGVRRFERVGERLFALGDDLDTMTAALASHGLLAAPHRIRPASLEDVFLLLTGRELRD
jgi:lipooligosaccharide transport system ATP-binding protein